MPTYEQQLNADLKHAFREGSMHFEEQSAVHRTLRKICADLDRHQIAYCIVGGMALFFHGYRRFTDDVDLLVTPEGLQKIHSELEGRGYLPPFEGSKTLRDTETGVRIEFLTSGGYPGDGKPKPVKFPEPASESVEVDGLRFLKLERLIELKLASGLSNPRRARDIVDVQELVDTLQLPRDMAEQLDESVRARYYELWQIVQDFPA